MRYFGSLIWITSVVAKPQGIPQVVSSLPAPDNFAPGVSSVPGGPTVDFSESSTPAAAVIGKDDHKITFEESLSDAQVRYITTLMEQRKLAEVNRDFDELVRMAFWHAILDKPVMHSIHDVSLADSQNWFDTEVSGHGCYCWPDGERRISGFGPRKDALDETCFDLWNCYRCVNMIEGCKTTNWVTAAYGCAFADEDADGNIELKCTDRPDHCGRLLCECDLAFAKNVKAAAEAKNGDIFQGVFPDECQRQGNGDPHGADRKQCCGRWPHVKPYLVDTHCCGNDHKVWRVNTKMADEHCVESFEESKDEQVVGPENNPLENRIEIQGSTVGEVLSEHSHFHTDNPGINVNAPEHAAFHAEMDRQLRNLRG